MNQYYLLHLHVQMHKRTDNPMILIPLYSCNPTHSTSPTPFVQPTLILQHLGFFRSLFTFTIIPLVSIKCLLSIRQSLQLLPLWKKTMWCEVRSNHTWIISLLEAAGGLPAMMGGRDAFPLLLSVERGFRRTGIALGSSEFERMN